MGQETTNKIFQIRKDSHYNFYQASQFIVSFVKVSLTVSLPIPDWGKIHLNKVSFGNRFSFFFLSFYYNKIHPLTNYKAIKTKSNKTGQHRTQNLYKAYTA